MTGNQELDPSKLTFSQARGYEPIPGQLALEKLSQEARVKLWDLLLISVWTRRDRRWSWKDPNQWQNVFYALHREFLVRPLDEFTLNGNKLVSQYRGLILSQLPFYSVFDLFQMIIRHRDCPRAFTSDLARIFKECRLAYVIDKRKPATILPAATKEEGQAIIGAIRELRQAGLHGAETHLKKAGEAINEADWPGAVRESIHAVESVARLLAPDANTLSPALAELERGGRLHPALRGAFDRLYGYTSDEEGIRHPLIDEAESPVGQDEAVFMLGACASFASYLWRRHQAGI